MWEDHKMKEILLRTGEEAIRRSMNLDISEIELYLESRKTLEINVEDGKIRSVSLSKDRGCGIRSIVDKRVGFSYVTTLEQDDIDKTIQSSISLARVSTPDSDFQSLPISGMKYTQVKGIFDSLIENLSSDDAAELILRGVQANRESLSGMDPKIIGILQVSNTTRAIVNSHGISEAMCLTQIMLAFDSTIRVNGTQANSYGDLYSCKLKELNPESIGMNVGIKTKSMLGVKKIEDGEMSLVLSPVTTAHLLKSGLAEAIKASNVQNEQSFLKDSLKTDIASDILTITDDGLLDGGISSRSFDAEGVPSKTNLLLQNGSLENFLHNSYTSNKANVENTGNAGRQSYKDLPLISSSNLVVLPGKESQEDLVAEVQRGILCNISGDRPDLLSGDLNAVVMEGYYIRDGGIVHPLANTIFSINFVELLKGITRIGGDSVKTEYGVNPSIVVEKVKVSSG